GREPRAGPRRALARRERLHEVERRTAAGLLRRGQLGRRRPVRELRVQPEEVEDAAERPELRLGRGQEVAPRLLVIWVDLEPALAERAERRRAPRYSRPAAG